MMQTVEHEASAVQSLIAELSEYEPQQIERILRTVSAYFGTTNLATNAVFQAPQPNSTENELSIKEFMLQKRPQSNPERMACLAYYLVRYRHADDFKTEDLARLNSEAAQLKFTDPIQATKDAVKAGLLISANAGKRRMSAIGEHYVEALPDRKAAREALQGATGRRKGRRRLAKPEVFSADLSES